jgi:hypothetical protein
MRGSFFIGRKNMVSMLASITIGILASGGLAYLIERFTYPQSGMWVLYMPFVTMPLVAAIMGAI